MGPRGLDPQRGTSPFVPLTSRSAHEMMAALEEHMATLKANGPELLRISQESDMSDRSISWSRTTRVYHANGVVLQKYDVRFRPTASFDPTEGRFYSYGWKKVLNASKNIDPIARVSSVLSQLADNPNTEWKVEFKSPVLG